MTHAVTGPRARPAGRRHQIARTAVAVVAALLTLSIGSVSATDASPAAAGEHGSRTVFSSRPNVVFIVVDDMRADEMTYLPLTRQLIGDEGVTFENSFSPYPLCCPARASFLTGLYTHNHRVFSVAPPWGFSSFKDQSTVATWLQDAGYATILLGKYLNGYGKMPEPGQASGNSLSYVPPGWTSWRASIDGGIPADSPDNGGTYRYFDTTISRNGHGFQNFEGVYQTKAYGDLAVSLVKRRAAADQPFFLYLSYTAPHHGSPKEADDPAVVLNDLGEQVRFKTPARPARLAGRFDDVITEAPGASWQDPDPGDKPLYLRDLPALNSAETGALLEVTRQRAEALHAVDKQNRRVIEALRSTGELDDTLLIFTSDNGYFLGEQHIRQGKILPYEPALRVPFLMRGPGIPAGVTRSDPITSIDVAPTIADAASVAPGLDVDGISLLPTARDGDLGWTRGILTETGPRDVVRETDESGHPLEATDPGERDTRWALGVRTAEFMYVDLATGEEELYDIRRDPQEYRNLVTDPAYASVLSAMRQQLAVLRACDGAQCRSPLPGPLAEGAEGGVRRVLP